MNELIKITYDGEHPTVSARELHDVLSSCKDFTEFFITVSAIKVSANREFLKCLQNEILPFSFKYGSEAITYLSDSISAEKFLPCNNPYPQIESEKDHQNYIVNHFTEIFPELDLGGYEVEVLGIGRIDILAKHKQTNRPVIMELKQGKINPNKQLIAYGSKYVNPILIAITEIEIPLSRREREIIYIQYWEVSNGQTYFVNKFLKERDDT